MYLLFDIFIYRSIEKLFYDSKIRVNGKKITKKSMDVWISIYFHKMSTVNIFFV